MATASPDVPTLSATTAAAPLIALVGNPNCGKTALFNRLTGARQKVGNYAGVTVERKEGQFVSPRGQAWRVVDLPGAYSLLAATPDEAITRDVIAGARAGESAPVGLVCVVDATNLRLNLRMVLELQTLGVPMVLAINMMDMAARRGIHIDTARLQAELGIPVVEAVAVRAGGEQALLAQLDALDWAQLPAPQAPRPMERIAQTPVEATHRRVGELLAACVTMPEHASRLTSRLDRHVLHPVFGPLILAALMFLVFQAVFSWAKAPMDFIDASMGALGDLLKAHMSEGMLRELLIDGVIGGAGSVLVFLPQIIILFGFILALEDSGYLPRAAFLLDRVMASVGLSGRAFIPLLSSFACAVPGIMATRTISDPRDRLVTILIAPLMTCSARLPVYAMLIAAFIFFVTQALVAGRPMIFDLSDFDLVQFLLTWLLSYIRIVQYGLIALLAAVVSRSLLATLFAPWALGFAQTILGGPLLPILGWEPSDWAAQLMLPGLAYDTLKAALAPGPMPLPEGVVMKAVVSLVLWCVAPVAASIAWFQRQDLSKE